MANLFWIFQNNIHYQSLAPLFHILKLTLLILVLKKSYLTAGHLSQTRITILL